MGISNAWNEMSYKRYENRKYEYDLEDCYENKKNIYMTYEDWYELELFGIENLFYLNYEE